MYFESREQAGQILAQQLLEKYRYENCAVVAMNDGGVVVGEQIAAALHSVLMMLVSEEIPVPGEGLAFGSVSQNGQFTYNSQFSTGEVEQYTNEFHGYLNEQKRETFQKINRLLGDGGTIDSKLLQDRVVIVVADGLNGQASLDAVLDFLKPIRYEKLVVAVPVIAVNTVDRLHVQADELQILDVKENFIDTNHYFAQNSIPDHAELIKKINDIIMAWQ